MKFLAAAPKAIREAAEIIRDGGLVAFPTETVYGLGADALSSRAVAKIFEVKNRPFFDPIIVHVESLEALEKLTCISGTQDSILHAKVKKLAEKFWPGPLTLVLPKKEIVPDIVTAGLSTVAIRMPSHPVALRLIAEAGRPIAAPSANPFGNLSPTTAEHVRNQIGGEIDMILDGGPCPVGIESTVLDLSSPEPVVLRPGGLPIEAIEKLLGKVEIASDAGSSRPRAPGLLTRHYSPRTPLVILGKRVTPRREENAGLLAFQAPIEGPFRKVEILSDRGDLREAAARFFACLHELDKAGLAIIYAEPVPEIGLGQAIMNRLRKAAGS